MVDVMSTPNADQSGRKRSRSVGRGLKSLVMPGRNPSPTKASPSKNYDRSLTSENNTSPHRQSHNVLLPPDHPAAASGILGERNQNIESPTSSPRKRNSKDRNDSHDDTLDGGTRNLSPFKRRQPASPTKGKENTRPPTTTSSDRPPPIWAQFATTQPESSPTSGRRPPSPQYIDNRRPHIGQRLQSDNKVKDFAPQQHLSTSSPAPISRPANRRPDDYNDRPSSKSSASSFGSDKMGKVAAAIALYNGRAADPSKTTFKKEDLDSAFEAVLTKRNVPETMRKSMRNLDGAIKADFIRHSTEEMTSPASVDDEKRSEPVKPTLWNTLRGRSKSRSRADQRGSSPEATPASSRRGRSRGRSVAVKDEPASSPTKRGRSTSRPRALFSLKNLSSTSVNKVGLDGTAESKEGPLSPRGADGSDPLRRPADFVDYLKSVQKVSEVEVGKLHKLRILLRNESVSWVDTFILKDGMRLLLDLFDNVRTLEWRTEHDDLVLHEVLQCLQGLCSTKRALDKLADVAPTLFPHMLAMLFDEERRGPSEFSTRGRVISLLFIHLSTASESEKPERARTILSYLADPKAPESERPPAFVLGMTRSRPYQRWCKEINNVIREVFWIFIHYQNVIPLPSEDHVQEESYLERNFPKPRAPEALNPWVGGVEWEATNYLSAHMDLLNGLIASLPTREERNQLREELTVSNFERVVSSLRLCKEKFYPAPHEVMRQWVAAAVEDEWEVDEVRMRIEAVASASSPVKNPSKENRAPPKLDLPNFDVGGDGKLS